MLIPRFDETVRGGSSLFGSVTFSTAAIIRLSRCRGDGHPHGFCVSALKDYPSATSDHLILPVLRKKRSHLNQRFFPTSANVDIAHVLLAKPDIATLASIVRRCASCKDLYNGKVVHQYLQQHGFLRNKYLSNCLVLMYADCECMDDAQEVFDGINRPNSFSWSILIKGYVQNGKLEKARHIFDNIPNADVVIWNTMISAYAQEQQGMQALDLFKLMVQGGSDPDNVTFLCILAACTTLASLEVAQDFLRIFSKSRYSEDVTVRTALIHLYGKFGRLDDAINIFDGMSFRDAVTWNAMIAMFAQAGHHRKALDVFHKMRAHNVASTCPTFVSTLDACAGLHSLEEGLWLHVYSVFYAFEDDIAVGNALINMYGKCGCLHEAVHSFNKINQHSVVSWTTLMTAYKDNDQAEQALLVFQKMQVNGVSPNKVTFVCALDACCHMTALDKGSILHCDVVKRAFECDFLIGTALINMYGKCGLVKDAFVAFKQIEKQDIASWNAILTAYARNGDGEKTLSLFYWMWKDGFTPNDISFVCILTVFSHMGWVEDGRKCFMSLYKDFNMRPTSEHCACMIDILGRAGCLEEAEDLIDTMPGGVLFSIWTSLLAACRIHGDVLRGSRIAEYFTEANTKDPIPYLILADIYAAECA